MGQAVTRKSWRRRVMPTVEKPKNIFQGMPRLDAIRQIGVTEQTYYRWKKKYGGMGTDHLKELKRPHKEN